MNNIVMMLLVLMMFEWLCVIDLKMHGRRWVAWLCLCSCALSAFLLTKLWTVP